MTGAVRVSPDNRFQYFLMLLQRPGRITRNRSCRCQAEANLVLNLETHLCDIVVRSRIEDLGVEALIDSHVCCNVACRDGLTVLVPLFLQVGDLLVGCLTRG